MPHMSKSLVCWQSHAVVYAHISNVSGCCVEPKRTSEWKKPVLELRFFNTLCTAPALIIVLQSRPGTADQLLLWLSDNVSKSAHCLPANNLNYMS